jgi:acyl carrier protein
MRLAHVFPLILTLQEFAIEIPDAEADEIVTVQQGGFPIIV